MVKAQMITYGILLVTRLLGRLRELNELDEDADLTQIRDRIRQDIVTFSNALSQDRAKLDEWLQSGNI